MLDFPKITWEISQNVSSDFLKYSRKFHKFSWSLFTITLEWLQIFAKFLQDFTTFFKIFQNLFKKKISTIFSHWRCEFPATKKKKRDRSISYYVKSTNFGTLKKLNCLQTSNAIFFIFLMTIRSILYTAVVIQFFSDRKGKSSLMPFCFSSSCRLHPYLFQLGTEFLQPKACVKKSTS